MCETIINFAESAKSNIAVNKRLKFNFVAMVITYSARLLVRIKMSSSTKKKDKTASKLDHQQEVFYPLDYSFKGLNIFEGNIMDGG